MPETTFRHSVACRTNTCSSGSFVPRSDSPRLAVNREPTHHAVIGAETLGPRSLHVYRTSGRACATGSWATFVSRRGPPIVYDSCRTDFFPRADDVYGAFSAANPRSPVRPIGRRFLDLNATGQGDTLQRELSTGTPILPTASPAVAG